MATPRTIVTVTLDTPVTFNGETFAQLTLRKLKARDLVAGDLVTGEAHRAMAMFASMAGVPLGVIEELDIDDFERLGQEAAPLMGKSAAAAIAKREPENEPTAS